MLGNIETTLVPLPGDTVASQACHPLSPFVTVCHRLSPSGFELEIAGIRAPDQGAAETVQNHELLLGWKKQPAKLVTLVTGMSPRFWVEKQLVTSPPGFEPRNAANRRDRACPLSQWIFWTGELAAFGCQDQPAKLVTACHRYVMWKKQPAELVTPCHRYVTARIHPVTQAIFQAGADLTPEAPSRNSYSDFALPLRLCSKP